MAHLLEPATTGRSKCRGCGQPIARGELRFGESVPNLFAEGDTTLWFHPMCAAYKRPQPLLETLEAIAAGTHATTTPPDTTASDTVTSDTAPSDAVTDIRLPNREALERAARDNIAHERLQRIDGAERAPSGQAKCRHCHEPIEKGSWRIRVVYFDEGRFAPGGSVHLACRQDYFGTAAMLDPVLHFSASLGAEDRAELIKELG